MDPLIYVAGGLVVALVVGIALVTIGVYGLAKWFEDYTQARERRERH